VCVPVHPCASWCPSAGLRNPLQNLQIPLLIRVAFGRSSGFESHEPGVGIRLEDCPRDGPAKPEEPGLQPHHGGSCGGPNLYGVIPHEPGQQRLRDCAHQQQPGDQRHTGDRHRYDAARLQRTNEQIAANENLVGSTAAILIQHRKRNPLQLLGMAGERIGGGYRNRTDDKSFAGWPEGVLNVSGFS
jgi:hypothetical protein